MSAPTSDRAAARQIITGLVHAGWRLDRVYDGEEDVDVVTVSQALDAVFAVDMAHLHVKHAETGDTGWVYFVLGNDPEEVVCDHTVNLSPAIDPVTEGWW